MEAVEVSAVMEDLLPVPATGLPDRFLDRAVLARVQQPCPRFGQGRQTGAAAGTGEVCDLLLQPGRVLHGPGCRAEASHRGGCGGPNGERDDAPGGALSDPQRTVSWSLSRHGCSRTTSGPHWPRKASRSFAGMSWRRREGSDGRVLCRADLPGAHPACRRSLASFPYISGLSINLAVLVRNPETGIRQFARVKVPTMLARFIPLAEGRYVALEDVIAHHLDQLFSGMQVVGHHIRVTRNEDVEVEEDDAENLLLALEKELLRRKVGPPVRLEVEDDMDPKMLELLVSELDIGEREVFHLPGPLDLRGLFSLADIDRAELNYPAFLPHTHPHLAEVEQRSPRTCLRPSSSEMCCCITVRLIRNERAALHRTGS